MQPLRFEVDTKPIEEAAKKIKELHTQIGSLNVAITKTNKANEENNKAEAKSNKEKEASAKATKKAADALDKLIKNLEQTQKYLSEGFSRGEANILKMANALGASGSQFKVVVSWLEQIKKLTKDPFDDAIGSMRRLEREAEQLAARQDLLAKGIKLTNQQMKDYSKLSDEIAGKMVAKGKSPLTKDLEEYNKLVDQAKSKYLDLANTVNTANAKEAPVKTGRVASISSKPQGTDQHVKMYYANLAKEERSASRRTNSEVVSDMDQHVRLMQSHTKKLEDADERRTSRFLANGEKRMANLKAEIRGIEEEQKLRAHGVDPNRSATEGLITEYREKVYSRIPANMRSNKAVMQQADEEVRLHTQRLKMNSDLGKSSKELAFAMRQVPMQITDIAVSLAAGQPPMMVMLQQGGQLKDMFGGVKEAAIGLGKGLKDALIAILGMLKNPIIALAITLGTLGAALWKGMETNEQFGKSLILMGNTAKITLGQVKDAASSISAATGSSLRESGLAFVEMHKVTGLTDEGLIKLTQTAINLQKYGGQAIIETAKAAAEFKADPVEAMQKFNKEIGFLTPEIVRQSQAFLDNGEKAKASALLLDEYEKAQAKIAENLKENEGASTRLWRNIKEGIDDTIDSMSTFLLKLAELEEKQNKLKISQSGPLGVIWNLAKETQGAIWKSVTGSNDVTPQQSWQSNASKVLGTINRPKKDIVTPLLKLREEALKVSPTLKDTNRRKELDDLIEQAKATGELTAAQYKYIEAIKASDEYKGKSRDKKDHSQDARNLFADQMQYNDKLLSKELEDIKKINDLNAKQKEQMDNIRTSYKGTVDLQNKQLADKAALNQMSEREKFIHEAKVKAENDYEAVVLRINTSTLDELSKNTLINELLAQRPDIIRKAKDAAAGYYDNERSFVTGWDKSFKAYADSAKDYSKLAENYFTKATDGMADAMVEFAMTGKLSFSNLADSIIRDILRIQAKNLAVSLMGDSSSGIFGGIAKMFGGSTPDMSGFGSDFGTSTATAMYAANGAYFDNSIAKFANGAAFTNSIVSSPTPFKFANGAKFGLMGEAGPEAIMPLSRDSSGKLGVNVNGASQQATSGDVTIVVNNQGNSLQVTEKKETVDSRGNRSIEITVSELVAKEQSRPGSSIYNSTRNSFGLKPTLVGR